MHISPLSVRFDFVGMGEHLALPMEGRDQLYLDVGNQLAAGVIDHHQLAAYAGSTAGLVLAHPDLVRRALNPSRKADDPFTFVLHRNPDLDCFVPAYLALALLSLGEFPKGAEALAHYTDEVDAGSLGMTLENPFSLYAACMYLAHRLSLREGWTREEMWQELSRQALDVVEFATRQAAEQQISLLEVDAFRCPGQFGPRDREDVTSDIESYRRKLTEPKTCARRATLRLPTPFGGVREVDTLLVRDVQNDTDAERVMFFKDWARSDQQFAPRGKGFAALSVFETESAVSHRRCILSVKPDSGVWLRGLGARLDEREAASRREKYGVDDRKEDPVTHEPKSPRPGYDNADPWYDGRAHGYTIVDAPRSGTLLSAEEIEKIFLTFGGGSAADVAPLTLPSPLELSEPGGDADDLLQAVAFHSDLRIRQRPRRSASASLDIFISYPRTRLQWVKKHVFDPLARWRGAERIFFDMTTLIVGADWVDAIADAIARCRVFLPIFGEDFFRSPYCRWEMKAAFLRDPDGEKRIIVPVMLEPVALPNYCSHIQALPADQCVIEERLRSVLSEIWEG